MGFMFFLQKFIFKKRKCNNDVYTPKVEAITPPLSPSFSLSFLTQNETKPAAAASPEVEMMIQFLSETW